MLKKKSIFDRYLKKDTHPVISTRPEHDIMSEWSSQKQLGDIFGKEIDSFTMGERKARLYDYRPNNYSMKIPLKAKLSLPPLEDKAVKLGFRYKIKPTKTWKGLIVFNYHGFTVEFTTKSLILYQTERQTRVICCKKDIDKVTESIIDKFLNTARKIQRQFGIKVKLNEWEWYRKEIGLKDDKLRRIDREIFIHDDVFKKVYEKETEFYDEVYVKNYISNRALEDLAPFLAQQMNDIRTILLGFQKRDVALENAILLIAQTLKKLEGKI